MRTGNAAILLALALLFAGGEVLAARVAVLPVEDLSRGDNGLNLPFTERLREALAARGQEVARSQDVLDFMARNRIRWLGRIDANHASRLGQELGVEYILLGSVNQVREKDPAALALTLQLVRAGDARLLWAGGAELCRADLRRLLAIAEPRELAEIERMVVVSALSAWPAALPPAPAASLQGVAETIHLAPQVAQAGETVRCRIRLDEKGLAEQTTMAVVVGEQIIQATYLAREQAHEASWPAPAREGRYPVSVSINSREMGTKNVFAGSFLVDSTPPELLLSLKGQELDGAVVLRRQLNITPGLRVPEPLSDWEIEILDSSDQVIKTENGRGNLPGRFSWWGQRQDGSPAKDGEYRVRLTVRDRAQNSASVTERFLIVRKKPELKVLASRQGDSIRLELSHDGKAPLVYWRLELRGGLGTIIYEASGDKTPASLLAPQAGSSGGKISALVLSQDILGNRVRQSIDDIFARRTGKDGAEEQIDEEGAETDVWSMDF